MRNLCDIFASPPGRRRTASVHRPADGDPGADHQGLRHGRFRPGRQHLAHDDLRHFRERFGLPLSDDDLDHARFYHPGANSREVRYLKERRATLGGYLPQRRQAATPITLAAPDLYAAFHADSGEREISTTMGFVRLLTKLMRDSVLGSRVVPIVADEAHTFGMQDMS